MWALQFHGLQAAASAHAHAHDATSSTRTAAVAGATEVFVPALHYLGGYVYASHYCTALHMPFEKCIPI